MASQVITVGQGAGIAQASTAAIGKVSTGP
jgi:hypothetical protein